MNCKIRQAKTRPLQTASSLPRYYGGLSAPQASRLLVLFDIDGTLVRRAGSVHREALVCAVRDVLAVETRNDNISVHGKLDSDILLEMMANAGVPRSRARAALPAIYLSAERYYARNVRTLRRKTCPGVRSLLERLRQRGDVLGIVSGNLERIGWKKLEMAALAGYFHFGVFAESGPTRARLARAAIGEARRCWWGDGRTRRRFRGVLIGDTPNDVAAGQANGLDTIAVATGLCSLDELRAAGPTLCVPDLAHPAVLEFL